MTIRLVKRKQPAASDEKLPQPASSSQLTLTAKEWVEEFRAQKARDLQALNGLMKRA